MPNGILLSRVCVSCLVFPQARRIWPSVASLELVPICSLNRQTTLLPIKHHGSVPALCLLRHRTEEGGQALHLLGQSEGHRMPRAQ